MMGTGGLKEVEPTPQVHELTLKLPVCLILPVSAEECVNGLSLGLLGQSTLSGQQKKWVRGW